MLLLRHGKELVVAQLHASEADEDAVGHGAAPYQWVGKGAEAGLVEIRLHVQKQAAAGYEIDLQNVVRQWFNG